MSSETWTIFDEIGKIDLGDGLEFPLIINFRSDWQRKSPYLGQGWIVPLLDSHVVQRDANAFDMISPDGYTFSFGRDPKNPTILSGSKGWKGEIKGNTITVHATCGWKLVFEKGLLTQMSTPNNRVVEIRRDREGVARDVVSGATQLLRVERDLEGEVVGLSLGSAGEMIKLEQTKRPIMETIAGRNVVGGQTKSIGMIEQADGTQKEYRYGVAEKLEPMMEVLTNRENSRKFTWDPETKRILSDGDWKYDIEPAAVVGHNAAMGRTNTKGQKEFWHYNQAKGEEIVQGIDGVKKKVSWFTSGIMSGKVRAIITEREDDLVKYIETRSYDETGRVLRHRLIRASPLEESAIFGRQFQYTQDDKLLRVAAFNADDKLEWRASYDILGNLVSYHVSENR